MSFNLSDVPDNLYLGPNGGTTQYRTNGRGLKICSYYWPSKGPAKGILVLAHGHGCYLCFDYLRNQGAGLPTVYEGSFVQLLNEAGFAVCGHDNCGAGRSEGLRCYCDSFDDYVNDFVETARTCDTLGLPTFTPGLPKYALGMSKGGCVVLTSALKEPELFAGAIALAPMVSLEKVAKRGINPYLRPVGFILNRIIPTAAILAVNRNTMFPDLQKEYDDDPNCFHQSTRVRSAHEYMRATEWLVANQSRLQLPLLLFHSEGDTQTDPEGTKRLYEQAQSEDKTFIAPPGMWHILLKEKGNEQVKQQIVDWLLRHTGPKTAGADAGLSLIHI